MLKIIVEKLWWIVWCFINILSKWKLAHDFFENIKQALVFMEPECSRNSLLILEFRDRRMNWIREARTRFLKSNNWLNRNTNPILHYYLIYRNVFMRFFLFLFIFKLLFIKLFIFLCLLICIHLNVIIFFNPIELFIYFLIIWLGKHIFIYGFGFNLICENKICSEIHV